MRDGTTIIVNQREVWKLEQHSTNPDFYTNKRQVFIIGCKGIPAAYGGFETFVDKLTEHQVTNKIRYHVAGMGKDFYRYEYNGAKCFNVATPNIGAAKAIYYDLAALRTCIKYCQKRPAIKEPIFYILACRIGIFISFYKKQIEKLGGILYINPDGHEWKRGKWSPAIRKYWKISERLMVKSADLLICDSINIEKYVRSEYKQYHPRTAFIAYGADTQRSLLKDDNPDYMEWLQKKELKSGEYYLVVGRFVPENNFEVMIREFMRSHSTRKLAIISTVDDVFFEKLEEKLHFKLDSRIKFTGTVYDRELLKKIRENACGYLHGHEVGGTNPSLLEAMGSTNLNLLLDIGFNREVAEDAALYWTKEPGKLAGVIDKADKMNPGEVQEFGNRAKKRIQDAYSWSYIVKQYETLFLEGKKSLIWMANKNETVL